MRVMNEMLKRWTKNSGAYLEARVALASACASFIASRHDGTQPNTPPV